MNCPKCNSDKMVMFPSNVIDHEGVSVSCYVRCEECWTTHSYVYSQPYLTSSYEDPLELRTMSGSDHTRWEYFKCSRPNAEQYTLVAKKGKYATKERLESMGFTIHEPTAHADKELPAYRLYELR